MAYEEEDTCHMRRRIHTYIHTLEYGEGRIRPLGVKARGPNKTVCHWVLPRVGIYVSDTWHMRRRIHVI
jgi:hypothetical protein